MADDELKVLRVATPELASPTDIEAFLENWARVFLRIEMQPLDGHALNINLLMRSIPGFATACGLLSPIQNRHTSQLIDSDDFVLVLIRSGTAEIETHGQTTRLEAGDAVLTAIGSPGVFTGFTDTDVINFRLKRDMLTHRIGDPDTLVGRRISRDNRALKLLAGYASILDDQEALSSSELRALVAMQMHDVAAQVLSREPDGGLQQGVRAARFHAIKQTIIAHLSQHDLTIGFAAKCHQLSESYVRQIFADNDTTFSDFVLTQRLAHAHRMLSDPRYDALLISAIAYETGFNDLSYFNRTFRRRFGASPSDVREQRKRDR